MSGLDTDLERRVAATLHAKADQLDVAVEPFDPALPAPIAKAKPDRRRLLAAAAFAAVLVVAATVLVIVLAGGDDQPVVPAVPPVVARLEIDALPDLTFQPAEITTRPGLNEITFRTLGGTHELVFADPALHSFDLFVPNGNLGDGTTAVGDVVLEAGRDYLVYCSIPGHREEGQETTIHVTSDNNPG